MFAVQCVCDSIVRILVCPVLPSKRLNQSCIYSLLFSLICQYMQESQKSYFLYKSAVKLFMKILLELKH